MLLSHLEPSDTVNVHIARDFIPMPQVIETSQTFPSCQMKQTTVGRVNRPSKKGRKHINRTFGFEKRFPQAVDQPGHGRFAKECVG